MSTPGGSYWDQHSQNRPDDQRNAPESGGSYTGPPPMQPPGGQPPTPPPAPQVPPYAGPHTEPYAGGPNAGIPGGYPGGGYAPYPGGGAGRGNQQPGWGNQQAGWGNQQAGWGNQQPMPSKHIGWAVVALLFFWPLAIPAFIYSGRVQPAWMTGNHAAALDASRKVRMFGIVSLCVGIVLGIIYIAVGRTSGTY